MLNLHRDKKKIVRREPGRDRKILCVTTGRMATEPTGNVIGMSSISMCIPEVNIHVLGGINTQIVYYILSMSYSMLHRHDVARSIKLDGEYECRYAC